MSEPSAVHSTFVIERRFAAAPGHVFSALSDPDQVRRWYAEAGGRAAETFEMEFRIRGRQRMSSPLGHDTPFPGAILASDAEFLDIVPGRRMVLAQTMTLAEQRISAALITYEVAAVDGGSELNFTHQGAFFEGSDGPEMREHGWRTLLDSLQHALAA